MDTQPRNEHALELALNKFAGSNIKAVEYRDLMAGIVLGQMLPDGCVVKGGTSMRLRFGPGCSRVTMDFDTSRRDDLDSFLKGLRARAAEGWCGFTSEVGTSWDSLYDAQKGSLPVLSTVDEAIAWANGLIAKIAVS